MQVDLTDVQGSLLAYESVRITADGTVLLMMRGVKQVKLLIGSFVGFRVLMNLLPFSQGISQVGPQMCRRGSLDGAMMLVVVMGMGQRAALCGAVKNHAISTVPVSSLPLVYRASSQASRSSTNAFSIQPASAMSGMSIPSPSSPASSRLSPVPSRPYRTSPS